MFVSSQSTQIRPFIIAESRNQNIERKRKTENKKKFKKRKNRINCELPYRRKHFFKKWRSSKILFSIELGFNEHSREHPNKVSCNSASFFYLVYKWNFSKSAFLKISNEKILLSKWSKKNSKNAHVLRQIRPYYSTTYGKGNGKQKLQICKSQNYDFVLTITY